MVRGQFGTEEQKERFLPKLAKGEMVGCFVSLLAVPAVSPL